MARKPHELEFWYEGQAVGYFETAVVPAAPGRARVPYRGPDTTPSSRRVRPWEQPYCCCRARTAPVLPRDAHAGDPCTRTGRLCRAAPAAMAGRSATGRVAGPHRGREAPPGWLYLPRESRTWTPQTPAVVLNDEETNELQGEADARDYGPTVDDGTLLSIVADAQDRFDIDSSEGLVEALVYYVRFDCFLPEVGTPDPPKVTEAQHHQDRRFYEVLGPESPDVPCRAGCRRGAITQSVFCRAHHWSRWARPRLSVRWLARRGRAQPRREEVEDQRGARVLPSFR